MKLIRVEFQRPSAGSMLVRFETDGSCLEIWASYIPYDSITELASAISLVLKGGAEAIARWCEEPTEYEFQFRRRPPNSLRLTVTRYPGFGRSARSGREVLRVEASSFELCLPFWRALRRLESLAPLDEYKAAWGHRFPASKVEEIAAMVRNERDT